MISKFDNSIILTFHSIIFKMSCCLSSNNHKKDYIYNTNRTDLSVKIALEMQRMNSQHILYLAFHGSLLVYCACYTYVLSGNKVRIIFSSCTNNDKYSKFRILWKNLIIAPDFTKFSVSYYLIKNLECQSFWSITKLVLLFFSLLYNKSQKQPG